MQATEQLTEKKTTGTESLTFTSTSLACPHTHLSPFLLQGEPQPPVLQSYMYFSLMHQGPPLPALTQISPYLVSPAREEQLISKASLLENHLAFDECTILRQTSMFQLS